MSLPVRPQRVPTPIVPHTEWRNIGRERLAKVYVMHDNPSRMAFVVQLLATNDAEGERYKLIIDGLDVTVGIEADAQEFIGDKERKRARYADEIYDDIVRYSAARDQL
jgi:hypothetical protein